MRRAINRILERVRASTGIALIYYSGHGAQDRYRNNFLLPVDADIQQESDIRSDGVSLNPILSQLGQRPDGAVSLVVLDACRNNPYTDSSKSIGKGLGRVGTPLGGTLVLYAASPGQTADDNPRGRNGLFTQQLLKEIVRPGIDIEDAFEQVALAVKTASGNDQIPYKEGNLLGKHYLAGTPEPVRSPPSPDTRRPDYDILAWQAATQCARPACYQVYLNDFPQGRFAAMAAAMLAPSPSTAKPPPSPSAAYDPSPKLRTCRAHFDANRLTSGAGGNALACYHAVLRQAPGNSAALAGIDAIAQRYGDWAESNLKRGRLDRSERYLWKIARLSPESPRLTKLQGQLRAARDEARSQAARQAAQRRTQQAEDKRRQRTASDAYLPISLDQATGAAIKIRRTTTSPSSVGRGQTVTATTEYSIITPKGKSSVNVIESWAVKKDGKKIVDLQSPSQIRTTGGWSTVAEFEIPTDASPGTYIIEHKVRSGTNYDIGISHFIVY